MPYLGDYDYEREMAKKSILERELSGSQSLQKPEVGQGAGSSYESPAPDFGGAEKGAAITQRFDPEAPNTGSLLASGASGAAAGSSGGPYGAAIGAGIAVIGSLLAQSMANKAQASQNKRQRAMEIEGNRGSGERSGIDSMLQSWTRSLR
jgi:hypothetical protein